MAKTQRLQSSNLLLLKACLYSFFVSLRLSEKYIVVYGQTLTKDSIYLVLLLVSTQVQSAFVFDPELQWKTLHTAHFEIHYHDEEAPLAAKTAAIAERVHTDITRYFQWTPKAATQIVITDRLDISNGAANPIPRNTISIIVTPPDETSALADFDSWLEVLIKHEYTHIVHIDKALGIAGTIRHIFGRLLWTFPNVLQPLWVIEGIATFKETDTDRSVGRGQNTLFKSLMRLEVNSGIKSISQVNQSTSDWPLGTIRYLYGVYFFNFLRDRYGEEKIKIWINEYSDNILPFSINSNARSTFGKDLSALWEEFTIYLTNQFQPPIEKITTQGLSQPTRLTNSGYFTANPRITDSGDIVFIQNNLLSDSKLMLLRNGQPPRAISNVYGNNFDLHTEAGILLTYTDLIDSVNLFSDIYLIDLESGEKTQLTFGQRYQYATWGPRGKRIIAVENRLANKALHLLNAEGELQEILWQGNNGEIVGQPDWSANGDYLVAPVWRAGNRWNLELFNLNNKKWKKLTDDNYIKTQPQFSHDGKDILYCSDYDGIYNVYQLNMASGQITKLTNLVGGAFSVSPMANGNGFVYLGLHSEGYDVYKINQTNTVSTNIVVRQKTRPSKHVAPIQLNDSQTTKANITEYSPFANLLPTSWFPVIESDNDKSIIGAHIVGNDPLLRHRYDLTVARDFKNDWTIGQLRYIYDRWNPSIKLRAARNIAVYRSNDGKIASYRNSDSVTAELIWPFLKRDQQWSIHFGLVNKREQDKKVINPILNQNKHEDNILGLAVNFNSSKFFPRAISKNTGQQFRIVAEDYQALNNHFTGKLFNTDWRGYYALNAHQVLATRVTLGWGTKNPERFRLGGINNGFSIAPPSRPFAELTKNNFGKRSYALRGYPTGLTTLAGRRMVLTELEWRFPLLTVDRGFMAFPIAVNRIHGKVFYNAGSAWQDKYESDKLFNGAGLELMTEVVIGYHAFPLDVRIGYAHGFDTGGEDQTYITIGGTF